MSRSPSSEVTELLLAWSQGEQAALDKLIPLVHGELSRLAHHYLSAERPNHTLQTTALVNEVYLRLVDSSQLAGKIGLLYCCLGINAAILVDLPARKYQRGGGAQQVTLDEATVMLQKPDADLVALDDALNALSAADPRMGQVVELRFFGGLTEEESAEVLKVSPQTVRRDLKLAKVWLLREMDRKQG